MDQECNPVLVTCPVIPPPLKGGLQGTGITGDYIHKRKYVPKCNGSKETKMSELTTNTSFPTVTSKLLADNDVANIHDVSRSTERLKIKYRLSPT